MHKYLIIVLGIFVHSHSLAQNTANPIAPCGLDYGSVQDKQAIQAAMLDSLNPNSIQTTINTAKNTRHFSVGCPQAYYGSYSNPDTSQVSLSAVENTWNTLYKPVLEAYQIGCPEIARAMPSLGLAAYYARLANPTYLDSLSALGRMGQMLEAQQYSTKYAPSPLVAPAGIYGYFNGTGSCQLTGVAGSSVAQFCASYPTLCVTYNNGLYNNQNFAITDHVIVGNQINGDLGGAGFDQGWGGVFMIEGALQQTDTALQQLFLNSALLAGEWSITHPLSNNHNYTAKLVWLLAELYAWTGRQDFKTALIDKLERNLRLGVLMDSNQDGFVDGMSPNTPFDSLNLAAQIPGRMWDAHNAQPWYHSMNALAMLEAYVAFRDRGDLVLANTYKPYVIAMIDNLAHEFVHLGIYPTNGTGWTDGPFSILMGIWKLAQYENEAHPLWEQAAWAIWNSGVFNTQGSRGINIPLYLLIKNQTPYTPLHLRSNLVLNIPKRVITTIKVYPNPVHNKLFIQLEQPTVIKTVQVYSLIGQLEQELFLDQELKELNLSLKNLNRGVYFILIQTPKGIHRHQIIKN